MADRAVAGPLVGKCVLVTRAREQASALARLLESRGAIPVILPLIEFVPPPDPEVVADAIHRLDEYDWLMFTSANGARFFGERLKQEGIDPRGRSRAKVAAIGPATAVELTEQGFDVTLVPTSYVGEAVVEEFERLEVDGKRFLFPSALAVRDVVAEGLRARGAIVDHVPVYQTVGASTVTQARQVVSDPRLVAVTLTSSSTARQLVDALGPEASSLLSRLTVAAIGPMTAQSARELGLTVHVEASEHTSLGLVTALEQYFEG